MSIFATYFTNARNNLCDSKPFVYNSVIRVHRYSSNGLSMGTITVKYGQIICRNESCMTPFLRHSDWRDNKMSSLAVSNDRYLFNYQKEIVRTYM